jgi:phenylacetate-CoA ligase
VSATALRASVDDVEFMARTDILALQRAKLVALGRRLQAEVSWRAHFATAGVSPADLAAQDGLAASPMLEKADLRAFYPFPFLTIAPEQVARFVATSGTTGLPVLFGLSHADIEWLLPWQLGRIFRAAGLRPGERVYQGYGYGMWIGGVAMDIGLKAYGAVNIGMGPGRGELAVAWLRDHAITACTMSPLWLMTLAGLARSHGIDPRRDWRLRLGIFGGQSVSAAFRAELEAAMPDGFLAHNVYGTTEAGGPVVSVSCPHSHADDEMHLINEDTILTEILDPATMRPVGPGEVGEIVVTTLDKQASPVVRWRTRDLVRLSAHPFECPCGRVGMPRIGRIIGRSDDMLKVRGVMVFPSQVEDVLGGIPGLAREAWQIVLDSVPGGLDGMTVQVERLEQCPHPVEDLPAVVEAALNARFGLRCAVTAHAPGSLPRHESKAVRVMRREHGASEQPRP